jgi:hypothetical protein
MNRCKTCAHWHTNKNKNGCSLLQIRTDKEFGCTRWEKPKPRLARCGLCGATSFLSADKRYWICIGNTFCITGPYDDPTGEKWDAVQKVLRRGGKRYDLLREYVEAAARCDGHSLATFADRHDFQRTNVHVQVLAKLDAMGESDDD